MQAYLNTLGIIFPGLMFEATSEGFLMSILDHKSDTFMELEKSSFIQTSIRLTTKYSQSYVACNPNENLYYLTKRAELYVAGKIEDVQKNASFSLYAVIVVPVGVPHYFKRVHGIDDGVVYIFNKREPFVADSIKSMTNE